jgi:hypothetical protein
MRVTALPLAATPAALDIPGPDASTPSVFPWFPIGISYASAVESRLAHGAWGKGDAALWIRTRVPLVAGEATSPLQRVMIAADSGNGIAVALDHRAWTFVNADLTVALHRPPAGEWVCVDAATTVDPRGVGLTRTRLCDEHGVIGLSHQSLVIEKR